MEELQKELAAVRERAIELARERMAMAETIEYVFFITEGEPGKLDCDLCKQVNSLTSKHMEL